MYSKRTSRRAAFSLVELIVVMVILGVLAATALPKFISVNDDAAIAAHAATGGAFASAVSLAHAQWIMNGHTAADDNLAGFGNGDIDTNATGWPVATDNNNTNPNNTRCLQIWNGLMQNPPTATTTNSASSGDYYVWSSNSGWCYYRPFSNTGMRIDYYVVDGRVLVDDTP